MSDKEIKASGLAMISQDQPRWPLEIIHMVDKGVEIGRMKKLVLSILAYPWLLAAPAVFASDAEKDEVITKLVSELFAQHSDLGTQVDIHTVKGTVYLNGFTSTSLAKANAEMLARTIDGVKKVIDNMGISK